MNKQTRTKLPEGTTQVRNASTGEVKVIMGKYFKESVRKIALDNGFKYKAQDNGVMDLNPYVFDFAKELIESSHDTLVAQNKALKAALEDISALTNNYNVINAKQIADLALGNGKKQ